MYTLSNVIKHALTKISSNQHVYSLFLTSCQSLPKLLKHYFVLKEWNWILGDIIPLAIVRAFSKNIVIILQNNTLKDISILPCGSGFIEPYIIILMQQTTTTLIVYHHLFSVSSMAPLRILHNHHHT